MRTLRVSLKERSYEILVGEGLLSHVGGLIRSLRLKQTKVLLVTQTELLSYGRNVVLPSLLKEKLESSFFVVPPGKSSEQAKSWSVVSKLVRAMAAEEGRNHALFLAALGGGVIGDLTGFTASIYRRGVPYVQIPTTLTAQVDSAIGGKTAIDLPEAKNLLGTIFQPSLVLSDISVLESLPDRHWSDGFAEVIKYGVIQDPSLFLLLEKSGLGRMRRDGGLLEKVVCDCARIKAKIVEVDEWDKKGKRAILNFGHTVGHAIEAASGYTRRYTHGEAVAVGMLAACDMALQLGILKEKNLRERLERTLLRYGLPVFYKGLEEEPLLKAMGYDKKMEGGKNRFVLPVSLGKVVVTKDVPLSVIREALRKRRA
ncbi:MAG: 3-dehydroquinate synthase [Candidatus Omnitrophica bacterium]|nr:3-dehydroquinate synthase [Candidatus Omnitrophota bacterium]